MTKDSQMSSDRYDETNIIYLRFRGWEVTGFGSERPRIVCKCDSIF